MMNLAKTGYAAKNISDRPIDQIIVRGERSSGTNFCEALVKTIPDVTIKRSGWKHGFYAGPDFDPNVLVLGIVRNWRDWLFSMYRKPWHTSERLHALPFSEFIREPWDSYFLHNPKGEETWVTDRVLYADRHPVDASRISNILELRNLKNRNLLGFANRRSNVLLVKYEWLNEDPSRLSTLLRDTFGILQTPDFGPIETGFAQKYKWYPEHKRQVPAEISAEDLSFIRNTLDRDLEAALGYELPVGSTD